MKVPAHVFYYSIIFGGTSLVAFAISKNFGQTEEEKIAQLEKNYGDRLKANVESRKYMQSFLNQLKKQEISGDELDDKCQALLRGGKTEMKRIDNVGNTKL